MKLDTLISTMKKHQISLPNGGTGLNGRVISADLEHALGSHFLETKYLDNPGRKIHCQLRRNFKPMKAMRYDKLKEDEKTTIFEDSNDWIAEQKYNGWRLMITYVPGEGLAFWGGNISSVDFLPVDYTDHILPPTCTGGYYNNHPFILDAEGICEDDVQDETGTYATTTLGAVGIILGGSPERAINIQLEGVTLQFHCFDCLLPRILEFNNASIRLSMRRILLDDRLKQMNISNFYQVPGITLNKKQYLHDLWTKGEEGIILKNITQPYVSAGRLRTHAVKVKRSMSGEIGDDIDAFISGYTYTTEWTKKNLIGGVELSVYMKDSLGLFEEHVIATVSNMPLEIRRALTAYTGKGEVGCLNEVVVVDGQELSSKNRKLMHANVDWDRGFRDDKSRLDCVLVLEILEEEKF